MQEEVTQKTMALAITTSRMTASILAKAMRKFLEAQKNKSHQLPKGKQTLKELMKHNTGVSNLEITNDNIRAFSATAKKYGIDFALKKDSSTQPPRYLVFFKGRDGLNYQKLGKELMSQDEIAVMDGGNRHLPQICPIPLCGEQLHLFIYQSFFLSCHPEFHLDISLSVRHRFPPFF